MAEVFRPRVLMVTYYDRDIIAEPVDRLRGFADIIDINLGRCLTEEEMLAQLPGVHVVIAADELYSPKVLDSAKDLMLIAREGTGYDKIDLDDTTDRGIIVTRAPVVHHATANVAMGLIIATVRKIPQCNSGVRKGLWTDRGRWLCPDIMGMTLGLVGFGQVGREVAKRAIGFGMKIMTYDPMDVSDAAKQLGVQVVSLDEVLKNSDVISVHVRHMKETAGMFDAELFSKMKKDSYFINTARGGLVNEKDLLKAVKSGHLAGVGLDVFAEEPTPVDNELLSFDNVVCTPHIAGDTTTTMVTAIEVNVQQIADVLAGKRPEYFLNPQVWEKARLHNIIGNH